jgi:hypothetical protein
MLMKKYQFLYSATLKVIKFYSEINIGLFHEIEYSLYNSQFLHPVALNCIILL